MPKKHPRVLTPTATAKFAHLNKPDTQFNKGGVYHVTLIIPKDDASELVDQIKSIAKKHVKRMKEDKPTVKAAPLPFKDAVGEDGTPTGELEFKFKMNATGGQGQDQWTQRPHLVDAEKKPMTENIGHGSKVRVSGEIVVYNSPSYGAGVSLRLKAVQVIELREYSSAGGDWGFDKVEGFKTTSSGGEEKEAVSDEVEDFDFD